jgi:hypothetical protein
MLRTNAILVQGFYIFTAMKIQVVVFWDITLYSDIAGYQHFGKPCSLHLQPEGGGTIALRNVGVLPHH